MKVLADGLGHHITQLFHIIRKILSSPVKNMRGVITTSVLTWAVGGHEQLSYTLVTAVALYSLIFLFIWFILYLSAHDGFCFTSRLQRARYCFLQRFVHPSLLASFMLPVAKFLVFNKPGRPFKNQPWQLKNKCISLSNVHRADLYLCPYLCLTSPDTHSSGGFLDFMLKPLACRR